MRFNYNPVKHGLVQRVEDWPWSTYHRYVHEIPNPALLVPDVDSVLISISHKKSE